MQEKLQVKDGNKEGLYKYANRVVCTKYYIYLEGVRKEVRKMDTTKYEVPFHPPPLPWLSIPYLLDTQGRHNKPRTESLPSISLVHFLLKLVEDSLALQLLRRRRQTLSSQSCVSSLLYSAEK
jgi:hypothetical protein